jgi:hypothetical protein
MRKFANLFLLLFVLSALTDIADQLAQLLFSAQIFTGLNQWVWLVCFFSAVIVYFGFAFNRHLPKVILLPIFIWLLWTLVGHWPLENIGGQYFQLFIACGQLLLITLLLNLNRQLNHKSQLFTQDQFAGPSFSGKNLIYFSLINLLVVPVVLFLIGFSFVGTLIKTNTAGFVQLKPDGLYMTERIYQRGNKQIRLVGMIHLGQEEYYDDLTTSISGQRTLILAEGVSDRGNLLTERFSYGKLAGLLGLTSQEGFHFQGRLIDIAELDQAKDEVQDIPDILRADIDLQQFDPRTLEVLNALAKYLLNSESPLAGYVAFNRWADTHFDPDLNSIIMTDLISKRNRSVLSYLPKALAKYDTVIIPWGALHLPGIEKAVQKEGFRLKQSHHRLSIDFSALPYRQLWERLWGASKHSAENGKRLSVMSFQIPTIVSEQQC